VIDVDSGEVEQLGYWEATHDGLSVDRMRSTAAQVRSTFQARPEVSLIDVTTATETTITTLNDRSGAPRPAPAHRRLKARRAGVPIESWMLTPPGFDAARRHPLIVDVMGGPYWFWSSGFDPVVAALLGNGFVVLLPHPRGSGSSGREFAHLADARGGPYGGEPFLDVMAALDDAARLPGVDPERVGIYGSSYGGYMVAWAITQTDRFRAAVCRAPITDFTAHITVSDCGVAMARDELPGLPDERQEWYDRHSPIRHARKASTPTLFSCGEEDGRTPIANAEAMFLRLKLAGCDTELVRYPGASHMMPWEGSPRQREDWLRRTVAWFTTHLRSDAGRSR
jgi:acylaminoacyl-peptidase